MFNIPSLSLTNKAPANQWFSSWNGFFSGATVSFRKGNLYFVCVYIVLEPYVYIDLYRWLFQSDDSNCLTIFYIWEMVENITFRPF